MENQRLIITRKDNNSNYFFIEYWNLGASQVAQVVKNPLVNAEVARDVGWIPGLGISSRGGNGNPLQYSCMENHMNRGTWWAMVHGLAKSWTPLK